MDKHWTVRDSENNVVYQEELGRGGYGEVHKLCNTASQRSFARKLIRPFARIKKEDIENEFRALNKLCKSGHPNIVQVLDYGQLKENGAFYFIDMEFCNASLEMYLQGQKVEGLSEWSVIRQRDEVAEHARAILQHIINGLLFIHFLGEVHRDLSPQNVLYHQGHWKIADFGLTSEATSNRLVTSISARGKPCYRAPELLGEPSGYNNKTDVWSLGCIGYELFTGQKAFRDDFHVFQYSTSRNPPEEVIQQLTPIGQYYVQDLLEIDPAKRPSAKLLLLGKFGTDWNSTALKAAVEVPSRRSSLPDLTPFGGPSKLLGYTLCWAGLNQAVHPEFFETLLQVFNVPSASRTVTLEHILQEHILQEHADSEFSPADRVFMSLKVALLAGAFGYLGRLLRQTPDGNEKDEASIERYVHLWETHTDVVKGLGERGMLIHHDDYMHKEALFRLATKSSTKIAEAISRIIPGDMKIVGDDWAAILSPSDLSQDLSISLVRNFMLRPEYSSPKTRFSRDGKYIAVCLEVKKPQPNDLVKVLVIIFDIDSAREVARIFDVIHNCNSLANFAILRVNPGIWRVTFVLSSGDIVISNRAYRLRFETPGGGPSCFELSQDGTVLVWGSDDNFVGLRHCFSGRQLEYWTVKDCPPHSVAVSSDNKLVAATGANGLYVWNRASPDRSFYCERSCVRSSTPLFCNTSNAVFVGSGEGTIDCWETDSDTPLATLNKLIFSPTIPGMFATLDEGQLRVWRLKGIK